MYFFPLPLLPKIVERPTKCRNYPHCSCPLHQSRIFPYPPGLGHENRVSSARLWGGWQRAHRQHSAETAPSPVGRHSSAARCFDSSYQVGNWIADHWWQVHFLDAWGAGLMMTPRHHLFIPFGVTHGRTSHRKFANITSPLPILLPSQLFFWGEPAREWGPYQRLVENVD